AQVFITGACIIERELKSMSDTLNISSEFEEVPRSTPIVKNYSRIKIKRVAETKIASAMAKWDERVGSAESCIALRFAEVNDTNIGHAPITNLIVRSAQIDPITEASGKNSSSCFYAARVEV
ncbi:hypothetical protein KI387_007018, partial [Taxus chinensis]